MSIPTPVRGYHHGDFREALRVGAERLMTERSGWTFTLREDAAFKAAGQIRADPDATHALAAWSLIHRLAMSRLDDQVSCKAGDAIGNSLIGAVAATLIEGLAVARS